jgi:hypothetical protein
MTPMEKVGRWIRNLLGNGPAADRVDQAKVDQYANIAFGLEIQEALLGGDKGSLSLPIDMAEYERRINAFVLPTDLAECRRRINAFVAVIERIVHQQSKVDALIAHPEVGLVWSTLIEKGLHPGDPDAIHKLLVFSAEFSRMTGNPDINNEVVQVVVMTDLENGQKPRGLFSVDGLPFVFKRGETLLWAFRPVNLDEEVTRRHYVGGSLGASFRVARGFWLRTSGYRGHQVEDKMIETVATGVLAITEGASLAGARAPMRRHEDVVLVQLDLDVGRADPEPLADEAMGPRVVGAGEDDMAVGVELGPLPLGQLPGGDGQPLQCRALHLVEDLQGDLLRRAVDLSRVGGAGWPGGRGDRGPDARPRPGDASHAGSQAGTRTGGHMSPTRLARRGSRRSSVCPSYAPGDGRAVAPPRLAYSHGRAGERGLMTP